MSAKTATKATASKSKTAGEHSSYADMITDAITTLKERNGSSRSAIKKYVQANNKDIATGAQFDSLFNRSLKAGVTKGLFEQPKGPSGTTKLAKKTAAPKAAAEKKTAAPKKAATTTKKAPVAAKKATTTKKAAAKPAAEKKAAAPKKAAPKKEAAPKKAAVKKAAAPKKAAPKKAAAPKAANAVVEKPTILSKTKSGRVTKTAAKPAAKKAAAPKKKAAPKKATPKKA